MTQKDSPQKIPRLSTHRSVSAAARWRALVNRDPTVDQFVYGVLTTGIYCRPSCPARLARRANITFYDTPSQAEAAGFRPCKRCKPESANPQQELVQKACATIESDVRAGLKPKLQRLADEANLTPSHFHRTFKRAVGVTPGQYATRMLNTCRGIPQDGCGHDENEHTAAAGIWDVDILDPCVLDTSALSEAHAGAGELALWNEFDFLLAAENEYSLGQGMQYLDGLFLPVAGSESSLASSDYGEPDSADSMADMAPLGVPGALNMPINQ